MKKVLLVLAAGLSIGISRSETKTYFIIKQLPKELQKINQDYLKITIKALYRSKLVDFKEDNEGNQTLVLTEAGKKRVLVFNFERLKFKKQEKWDGYWRIIIFDIPEKFKRQRDALSQKLRSAGAYALQKSVFIYPYDIKDEFDFLVEFFNLRKYVRFGILKKIDNELHLKKIFNLS